MNLFGASATERCVLTARPRPFPTKDLTIPENALFVTSQQLSPCCTDVPNVRNVINLANLKTENDMIITDYYLLTNVI